MMNYSYIKINFILPGNVSVGAISYFLLPYIFSFSFKSWINVGASRWSNVCKFNLFGIYKEINTMTNTTCGQGETRGQFKHANQEPIICQAF